MEFLVWLIIAFRVLRALLPWAVGVGLGFLVLRVMTMGPVLEPRLLPFAFIIAVFAGAVGVKQFFRECFGEKPPRTDVRRPRPPTRRRDYRRRR